MQSIVACHHCGAINRRGALPRGRIATCALCRIFLYERHEDSIHRGIVLLVGAAMLLTITHSFKLITINIEGRETSGTLFTGVEALFDAGLWPVALLCLAFASIFPAFRITVGLISLISAQRQEPSGVARWAFKLARMQGPWSMLEVYLVAIMVAYVKLVDYALIDFGPAAVTLFLTIIVIAWADTIIDSEEVWERIGRPGARERAKGDARPVACHNCGLVVTAADVQGHCPRCGDHLHRRKPQSLQRTWALLLTAMMLYIPANIYPMMIITQFGSNYPGTIFGGVVDLIQIGMLPIAIVVFTASILVPFLKFIGLTWLLLSVHYRSTRNLRQKTLIFTCIEWIGRWSMVDVFMISILAGLVQFSEIFSINPGLGSMAFCAVVVLTMLASMSFDPRLLWDAAGDTHERT